MREAVPRCCYARVVSAKRSASTATNGPGGGQLDIAALAQALKDRRTAGRLSIRQAAEDADISFMTLSRVEAGSQPDLATFIKLCAWLRMSPEDFLAEGVRRDTTTIEAVTRHLITDPALDSRAAQQIAGVVRDMYTALAQEQSPTRAVACHLRAATMLRPGVPDRLGSLLADMHVQLTERASSGEL